MKNYNIISDNFIETCPHCKGFGKTIREDEYIKNRDLYKEGRKYITCYVDDIGHLSPMGDAKTKEYAIEIAKKHKHILCRLVKLRDYRKMFYGEDKECEKSYKDGKEDMQRKYEII